MHAVHAVMSVHAALGFPTTLPTTCSESQDCMRARASMKRSSGALYLLRWMLVAVVVVCVSEGVVGADSGAVSQQEGAALCALLHSTRGDSWRWRPEAEAGAVWNCSVDAAGGLVHNPCSHGGSSWQGVTCSSTPAECSSQVCQVAKLDLTYYNLLGTLPSDIGNLSSLIEFSLYTNALSGTIPSELGQLQALTFLDVDDNFLSGTVPVEMGQLTALRFLYLNNNQLTGPIPAEMGQLTVLRLLYLHFNLLTGSIPAEVGQLTDLLVLYIHDNQLTKSIPVEVGQLISLAYLTLYDNQLTGSIPVEVGKLTELMKLYLNTNQLTGPIPTEIGQLISLEYLILNDNQLTRSIPVEVGNLTALVQLYLDRNQLTGPIPIVVGQLTSLKQLILYGNQLTRSIPVEVGKLSALELLYLYRNQLTSSIPVVIGQLTALQRISIHSNQFTGTIPVEVGQLTALQRIAAYDNYLTGSIPIEVGQLAALESLSLDGNHLTGSVPIEVGQLTALQNIFLNDNLLTGPIPVEVGHMNALDRMIAYDNFLTGSIPVEVGKLTALEQLFLYSNLLTGTMPAEIGQLSVLNHLTLHNNLLTGPIPEEIGQLRYLKELLLYNNRLGGPIPGSFGYLEYIEELQLHDNLLTGTLPVTLVGMMKLSNLFIQNNMLTGSLDGVFNHSAQLRLTTIDVSNNRFSGSAWEELFLLPQLQVLSLSGNCFTQQLSSALCRAERIEVLSMNGLGAAEECGGRTIVPLSGVALFNTIGGTIPSCVWALQNLTVLHLTGNGLTGELVSTLPAYTQLTDVSLSHNQLSGTLPLDIMKVTRRLDLSRNQFGGEYPDHTQSNVEYENINLEINRLSGQLPILGLELLLNSSLSVLRGNVFSCSTIPSNDDYTQDYVCGSRNLNYAMIGFVSAVAVVILGVIAIQWGRMPTTSATPKPIRVVSTLRLKCMLLWTYFTCSQNLVMWHRSDVFAPAVRNVIELSRSFIGVMRYAVQLATIVLVGSSVFYFVKALDSSRDYTTHSHTYSWFWTMAYMRGVVPAALLLAVWVGVITVSFYRVVALPWRRWHDIDDNDSCTEVGDYSSTHEKTEVARPAEVSTSGWYIARIGLVIVLNICSIAIVNAVYIYSTQQALSASVHLFLQLSMSIFRLLYSSMLCPILSQPVDNVAANIRFRFMLLMMNNLLLPCLVTAFTSDACFQGLLIEADTVSTPYSYDTCLLQHYSVDFGTTTCGEYGPRSVDSVPVVPSFTYNYQCGSVLLTSFIPVLLMGYSIQLVLPAAAIMTLSQVPYESIPPVCHQMFRGIMWPDHWLQGGDKFIRNKVFMAQHTDGMLQIRSILCNDVLNNWLLMLTFGLCSPILAAAIACCVVVKMGLWTLLMGRYARHMLKENRDFNGDSAVKASQGATVSNLVGRGSTAIADTSNDEVICFALESLTQVRISLFSVLKYSFWRLAWCSALFVGLLSWDLAGDEVGWMRSLWAPLLPLFHVLMLYCTAHYLNVTGGKSAAKGASVQEKSTALHEEGTNNRTLQNPLHHSDSSAL